VAGRITPCKTTRSEGGKDYEDLGKGFGRMTGPHMRPSAGVKKANASSKKAFSKKEGLSEATKEERGHRSRPRVRGGGRRFRRGGEGGRKNWRIKQ